MILSLFTFIFSASLFLIHNNKSYHDLPNDLNLISKNDIDSYSLKENESITPLKNILITFVPPEFSVYVEDYSTGEWMSINADKKMNPASLLKVPTLVAVLKKIEDKKLSLDDSLRLNSLDLDTRSGSLGIKGAGYKTTIKGLVIDLIVNSDNTALFTLNRRILEDADLIDARKGLDLAFKDVNNESISPKEFSNIFRNIYFSNYLNDEYSNTALNLLSKTSFRSQLPAGVPHDVIIAHKVVSTLEAGSIMIVG
jgi:beta-lactamase class A